MQSLLVRLIVVALILFSLVVDGAGYIQRLVNHQSLNRSVAVPNLPPSLFGTQLFIHQGLDLSGGSRMVLQLQGMPPDRESRARDQLKAVTVIKSRVDTLGVSEPLVEAQGDDQIVVELAGVSAARAQEVIGKTGKLVFTQWVKDDTIKDGYAPGYRPKLTGLSGSNVTNATISSNPQSGTGWVVNITLDSTGASLFGQLTAESAKQPAGTPPNTIGDWLDLTQYDIDHWDTLAAQDSLPVNQGGKFLTSPSNSQAILGGQFFIESPTFTQQTAQELASGLNSGSLPESIRPISSTDVDATLGRDSVRKTLIAGALGLTILIIFMIAYYRLPGLLASVALLVYAGIILMVLKVQVFPITVTLPGMAGFILSVGMAVDANVLIFERFKEEMRAGRLIEPAVDAAVKRAWPAIRDSNISTLITSFVLAMVGSGPVKGFAITLMIGVIVSMFSSIIVTQNLLAIVLSIRSLRKRSWLGVEGGRAV